MPIFPFVEPSVQAMNSKRASQILQRRQMITAVPTDRCDSANSLETISQRLAGEASPLFIDE
jgi:hypothetical protein